MSKIHTRSMEDDAKWPWDDHVQTHGLPPDLPDAMARFHASHPEAVANAARVLQGILETLGQMDAVGFCGRDALVTASDLVSSLLGWMLENGDCLVTMEGLLPKLAELLSKTCFVTAWEGRRVVAVLGIVDGSIAVDGIQCRLDREGRFTVSLLRRDGYRPDFGQVTTATLTPEERAYLYSNDDDLQPPPSLRPLLRAAGRFAECVGGHGPKQWVPSTPGKTNRL